MKNNLLSAIIILMVLSTSCDLRRTPDFESIDFSIYRDRAQKYSSLKIFHDGKTYIHSRERVHIYTAKGNNYVFTPDKDAIDTISLLTTSVINSKLDSVYITDCLSCMNFNLIIKTKNSEYRFFHIGDLGSDSRFKILEDYVKYLNKFIDRSMTSIDSSLKFESRTNRLLPPPPPRIDKPSD